jgi:hypothetical protein
MLMNTLDVPFQPMLTGVAFAAALNFTFVLFDALGLLNVLLFLCRVFIHYNIPKPSRRSGNCVLCRIEPMFVHLLLLVETVAEGTLCSHQH